MVRYPAYDPPEYVDWRPEPSVVEEYRRTIEDNPERRKLVKSLTNAQLLAIYEGLVRNRLHDITLKRWVKQGVISKAWLGTGEEAVSVGAVHALDRSVGPGGVKLDFVAPMIRNAGACHEMGMSVADMLRGYLGTQDSPTSGRDLHIGDLKNGVLAPISQVGAMTPITAGVALSFKLRREARVALTWAGDGSTKDAAFHEGMNFAAAQRLPLIVIVQNNQVALGTRLSQYQRASFLDLPEAYGVEGWAFDGNNVLDCYAAVKIAADRARGTDQGPFLLVAETFRMGGHATHDEREAREIFPKRMFAYWGKRDPIGLYETYLAEAAIDLESGRKSRSTEVLRKRNSEMLARIEQQVIQEVEKAETEALSSARNNQPNPQSATEGVYADAPEESLAGMLSG